jgi:hypothetical protein
MRRFAWGLVALGLVIAVVTPILLTVWANKWRADALERLPFVQVSALDRSGYHRALENEEALLSWRFTSIVGGLLVSGFGVLLLAIRRPGT